MRFRCTHFNPALKRYIWFGKREVTLQSKKITLKVLAEMMGVTPATISKALHDSSDISSETRKKVKKMAREMGYQPNILARSLVRQRSSLLGVIVPDLRISFYSEVIRGIYENAWPRGYEPIIVVNDEHVDQEKRNLEFLYSLNVDGILIDAVPGSKNNDLLKTVSERGIHIVCYDRIIEELDFSSVTINDEAAAFKIMQFFVENNRRHILFLGPTKELYVAKGRFRGYCKGLEHFKLPFLSELVVECRVDDFNNAEMAMQKALCSGIKIDAVMAVGGLVAYGAGRAILKAQLAIPNDIYLAEFGNNNIVHRLGVPFVTIDQSPYEMGTQAIGLIIDQIENRIASKPSKHLIIDTRLIHRQVGRDLF